MAVMLRVLNHRAKIKPLVTAGQPANSPNPKMATNVMVWQNVRNPGYFWRFLLSRR